MARTVLNVSEVRRVVKNNGLKLDPQVISIIDERTLAIIKSAVSRAKSNGRRTVLLRDV